MIVYENNVGCFIEHCKNSSISNHIISSLKKKGYNVGQKEINSWCGSLPIVANALDIADIDKDINVAVEYKFNMTKNRVDFLIYGKDENNIDNIVIVELKQWSDVYSSNKPNYVFAYGGGGAKDYEHPSYQSYRYKSILEGFNSYVQDNDVVISSCSYLHNLNNMYDFVISDKLKYPFIERSPVFLKDDSVKLAEFIRKYVKKEHRKLLYYVDDAKIRPSSNFSNLMYSALKGHPMFTLDDEQQNAVSTIVDETNKAVENNARTTIIIKGGPGTGKSIVAINALGQLLHPLDGNKSKNAVYCTTNFTPRTLYSELLIGEDYNKSAIKELFKSIAPFARARECDFDCIILDEAHRAFKWKFGQGVDRSVDLIDRLFYASRVNVFFIDEDQMVTKDDYLTVDRIKKYATRYKSKVIESNDLVLSTQFRCLGGENYISFINSFLGYNKKVKKYNETQHYDFRVFDSPSEMWNVIREKQDKFPFSRLIAGYTHDWVSKENDNLYDFIMEDGKFKMKWNKFVNYSYINDKTQFDRIGCIHTIQGVDMHFAGVIIGKDLKYRNGKLVFDQTQIANTDKSGIKTANKEDAEKMIRNTYKVLLTRGIYGTFVYCEDINLSEYLKSFLINN